MSIATRLFAYACACLLAAPLPIHAAGTAAPAATGEVRSDGFRYDIGPVPAFVVRHADVVAPANGTHHDSGMEILLFDRQISLLDKEPRDYIRTVTRARDSQGLSQIAQVYIEFNPDYQRLSLHAIRVIRDGTARDLTQAVRLDLLRREQGLEQNLYGGEVTGLGILSDVRVGDLVEVEYTVTGDNPIFAGRYAARLPLRQPFPMEEMGVRLVYPAQRALHLKAPAAVTLNQDVRDGIVTQTAVLRRVKALADDADRPAWSDPMPWLEASEYADWDAVRRWAGGLFQAQGELAPGLAQKLAAWKASGLPPARLATEVLRWVQGDIRYFGIELGVNSHQPAHPNLTFERRYGDCKDKSLLLATLLNGLGIRASPALASLRRQRAVADSLPGHAAFDHAIVRAMVDGRVYWLDPTLPPQPGPIGAIGAVDYGKALVLDGEPGGLAEAGYPPGYREEVVTVDRYRIKSWREPAELSSETVLAGLRAERVRWLLASKGREDFERNLRAGAQRLMPSLEVIGAVEIRDDAETNRLTLVERYRLPDLLRYDTGKFSVDVAAPLLLDYLKLPKVPQRATAFEIAHPVRIRQTLVFDLPENPIRNAPAPVVEHTPYWEMRTAYRLEPTRIAVDFSLDSRVDAVPPEAIAGYIEDTLKLRRKCGTQFTLRVAQISDAERQALIRSLGRYERFGNSRSKALKTEVGAYAEIVQTGLDIASGKLGDAQMAQAHATRAVAYDNTGRPEEALRDLDTAIRLAPGKVGYRFVKAAVLRGQGRFAEAVASYEALARGDDWREASSGDLLHFGQDLYYLGRYAEASARMEEAARTGDREDTLFAAYWQHLASRRGNGQPASRLDETLVRESNRDWPYAIGEMLLDRRSPESLLEAARSEDRGIERDRLCEAHFYIAQKFLLEGKPDQAREHFELSYRQDVKPYQEYKLAVQELIRSGGLPKKGLLDWLTDK